MIRKWIYFFVYFFFISCIYAEPFQLDEIMCKEDQKNTGVYYLSPRQKKALEEWLNENVILKEKKTKENLYLTLNLGNGKILQLSDGSNFQVAPEDTIQSALWIIPFEVELTESDDEDFPILMKNLTTNTSVKVKLLSEEEYKQLLNAPPIKQKQPKEVTPEVEMPPEQNITPTPTSPQPMPSTTPTQPKKTAPSPGVKNSKMQETK